MTFEYLHIESIQSIVQIGLADTKIGTQNAAKKVLELTEK